jgi:Rieske Fe-S protein
MPGEDQERFEDYLELESFIAELQAGHVAHPPQELTPAQARAYRMATLFHAATPGVSEPDPEFAASLQARLEREIQAMQREPRPTTLPVGSPRKLRVSRRMLLAGGATAAASVALGAGVEHMAEQMTKQSTQKVGQEVVITVDSPMHWFAVTTLAEMGNQAVKFRVETLNGARLLTGYVVRSDGTNGQASAKDKIIAMSAACTHKGCIVNWSGSDRQFHCPCHNGVFTQDGGVATETSPLLYMDSLPTLEVQVDDNGKISVRMPAGG